MSSTPPTQDHIDNLQTFNDSIFQLTTQIQQQNWVNFLN